MFAIRIYWLKIRAAFAVTHLLVIAVLCFPFDTYADDSNLKNAGIAAEISIRLTGEGYTLSAQRAELADVLYELGKTADFKLKLFTNLSDKKSDWNYESMVLIQLLNNLLRDFNTVMLYEEMQNDARGNTNRKLKELWLIASKNNPGSAEPASINIEIQVEKTEPTTKKQQPLTAEQQFEITHIDKLEGLTGDDVIETLKQTLSTEQDPVIRIRAVTALGQIGGTEVLDALESGLGDYVGEVRIELAKSFAGIQNQRSILALGQMSVGDDDIKVRQQALRALARQDGPSARAFIEAALNDEAKSVQKVARELLQ